MSESAPDARARRRLDAAAHAARFARGRTIADGLGAFTVEDVCEAAGFSRRTFFNYFASKEDAVLGIIQLRDDEDLEARFVEQRGDLLDDLATLSVARWTRHSASPEDATEIAAAIDREPRLVRRLFTHLHDTEQSVIALIERREGYEVGDPRASTIAVVFGTLMRLAVDDYFRREQASAFEDVLRERIALARTLFS